MVLPRAVQPGAGAVGGGASRAGVLEVAEGEAAVAVRTGGGEEQGESNDGQDSNNARGLGRAL